MSQSPREQAEMNARIEAFHKDSAKLLMRQIAQATEELQRQEATLRIQGKQQRAAALAKLLAESGASSSIHATPRSGKSLVGINIAEMPNDSVRFAKIMAESVSTALKNSVSQANHAIQQLVLNKQISQPNATAAMQVIQQVIGGQRQQLTGAQLIQEMADLHAGKQPDAEELNLSVDAAKPMLDERYQQAQQLKNSADVEYPRAAADYVIFRNLVRHLDRSLNPQDAIEQVTALGCGSRVISVQVGDTMSRLYLQEFSGHDLYSDASLLKMFSTIFNGEVARELNQSPTRPSFIPQPRPGQGYDDDEEMRKRTTLRN